MKLSDLKSILQKVYKMSQIEFCKIWVLEKLQDELSSGILINDVRYLKK